MSFKKALCRRSKWILSKLYGKTRPSHMNARTFSRSKCTTTCATTATKYMGNRRRQQSVHMWTDPTIASGSARAAICHIITKREKESNRIVIIRKAWILIHIESKRIKSSQNRISQTCKRKLSRTKTAVMMLSANWIQTTKRNQFNQVSEGGGKHTLWS